MGKHPIFRLAIVAAVPALLCAQWLNYPDPHTPRLKDGKPNLSAPAPRVHGKPDLSGIWQAESTPRKELAAMFPPGVGLLPGGVNGLGEDDPQKYFLNILADYKPGTEPLTPPAAAKLRQRFESNKKAASLCTPATVPMTELLPLPYRIVQTPSLTLLLYESDTVFRQIHTDRRKHPDDPQPSYMGYSVGHWEGDSFVVEARGFNDRSDLDAMGHFHTDKMRVTERFHRRDFGHMDLEITIEDPATFSKPVVIRSNQVLLPDTDVMEGFCTEGEQDQPHMPGK
jgi:hypothetical protein